MTDLMSPDEKKATGMRPSHSADSARYAMIAARLDMWIANRKKAAGMTNKELADYLVREFWSNEKYYSKQCAVLEEVIERLQKGGKKDAAMGTTQSS